MMKILMVTRESHADKRYGLNKSLAPIISELEQRGVEVGYLCQEEVGPQNLALLRSIHTFLVKLLGRFFTYTEFSPLLWGLLERLNMGRLAVKVMAREQYTHVHCHDPIIGAGYRWFARIRWFARLRRGHTARWGVTEHGFGCYAEAFHIDGARLGTGMMRRLRKWEAKILLKAHWVMTPTQTGLSQLGRDLAIYPIPPTWYAISHPYPQLKTYLKTEARQRLGWVAQDLYIIAVGRLAPLKNFQVLIQACAYLQQAHWQLVFIGEGDQTPLKNLATEWDLQNHIHFITTGDIGLYYSAADIYVSTSLTESFGLANLEALIMGLPAICTAVGGVAEVVGSGAYLIPPNDPLALIQALQVLSDDTDNRQYWQQQAQQWVQSWPNLAQITDSYVAMYQGKPLPSLTRQPTTPKSPIKDWHQTVNQWPICPLPQPLKLPEYLNILMIVPHPDDETLGCGGTLALLRQKGCHIKVVIITDGQRGDPKGYCQEDVVSRRQQESLAALQILGIDDVQFLNEPDSDYQHNDLISNKITKLLKTFRADWLLMPSMMDYHRDHVAISLSVLEAWQHNGGQERLFFYETWAPIPATWVVDIDSVIFLKQKAILCYDLPLRYCNYLITNLGLSSYRSLYLANRGQYAETFLELRIDSWRSVLSHLLKVREYQAQCLESS